MLLACSTLCDSYLNLLRRIISLLDGTINLSLIQGQRGLSESVTACASPASICKFGDDYSICLKFELAADACCCWQSRLSCVLYASYCCYVPRLIFLVGAAVL